MIRCLVLAQLIVLAHPAVGEVNATFSTNLGDFKARLFDKQAPRTVSNFVELVKKKFYNGLTIHRIVPDFLIHGGDPKGNGSGGPGYCFADEFHPKLRHDRPGILTMANTGRNSNGSQFMITLRPAPNLDGRHSIFGEITGGLDVVKKIATQPLTSSKPKTEIIIRSVRIQGKHKRVTIGKRAEFTRNSLARAADKMIRSLLRGIGRAQDLGPLQSFRLESLRSHCSDAHASYSVVFGKAPKAKLLILGRSRSRKGFEIEQFQFARGD